MDLEFLRQLRDQEIRHVIPLIPPRSRVLEIGAGAGWQAKCLSGLGFRVHAIDLPSSGFIGVQEHPVLVYDGHRIPFADGSFDVIFSSNVLEHIPWVEEFQAELQRVLAVGGMAVHVLPSPWWRLWTNLAHYPEMIRQIVTMLRPSAQPPASTPAALVAVPRFGFWHRLGSVAWPRRHGETGTSLHEFLLFSRWRWRTLFARTGWSVERSEGIRLFNTGYSLLGARLGLVWRARLACVLGSASTLYVMRRAPGGTAPASAMPTTVGARR